MENILKPDTLTLFLYFVVPGFVAIRAYDLLIPAERRDFGAALIEVVSHSLLNWVLFAPLLAVPNATNPGVLEFGSALARFGYVFVAPVVLAIATYYFRTARPRILRRLLKILRINIVDPMPTAWDEFFARGEPCYMLFHLKSKETIGGVFSTRSFATAYPGPQELYVEQLWIIDEANQEICQPYP